MVWSFLADESGASAAEYALILACIAAGLITYILSLTSAIGNAVDTVLPGFNSVNS
jgi:Flp pilus assembly pilin Flp